MRRDKYNISFDECQIDFLCSRHDPQYEFDDYIRFDCKAGDVHLQIVPNLFSSEEIDYLIYDACKKHCKIKEILD